MLAPLGSFTFRECIGTFGSSHFCWPLKYTPDLAGPCGDLAVVVDPKDLFELRPGNFDIIQLNTLAEANSKFTPEN